MIKCVIIDDELHCIEALGLLLKEYCPSVQIEETCRSAKSGIEAIQKFKPDLVFLDIEMPIMNGFEMLEQFLDIPFAIVFTTGYDQYAIKAIHFSALDYLLKPIGTKELVATIRKVEIRKNLPSAEQFSMLLTRIQSQENNFTKVAVPTSDGFELILPEKIIRCEADDNYTHLYLINNRKITACRTLKEVEELLSGFPSFVRVHHSYLVNLNEVTRYVRGEGGHLLLTDGSTVHVSRSRKEALLKFLGV